MITIIAAIIDIGYISGIDLPAHASTRLPGARKCGVVENGRSSFRVCGDARASCYHTAMLDRAVHVQLGSSKL